MTTSATPAAIACLRAPHDFEVVDALPPTGMEVDFFERDDGTLENVPAATQVVILASVGPPIATEAFGRLPRLRLVHFTGVGMDRVDADALRARGVEVRGCPAVNADDVAEYTLGAAILLLRTAMVADDAIKGGRYAASRAPFVQSPRRSLRGLTWGIVGFGTIGRTVGRLADQFRCTVQYYDVTEIEASYPARRVSIDDLLRTSDVVSIHTPLTPETRNLLHRERVMMLSDSAVLINVARGGIVDEEAVRERVEQGTLCGVAFDVFQPEPPLTGEGILGITGGHDRVLLSPHVAGVTHQAWHDLFTYMWSSVSECLREGTESGGRA